MLEVYQYGAATDVSFVTLCLFFSKLRHVKRKDRQTQGNGRQVTDTPDYTYRSTVGRGILFTDDSVDCRTNAHDFRLERYR